MDNVTIVDFGKNNQLTKVLEQGFTDNGEHIIDGLKESPAEGKKRCLDTLQKIGKEFGIIDNETRKDIRDKKESAHFDAKSRL